MTDTSKFFDASTLPAHPVERLKAVMTCLRDPVRGCPWDLEQTFSTLARYAIEEAYEVAEAAEANDMAELKKELGDLLLQVVFHAQLAHEHNHFNFEDVASAIAEKLIVRHPHVFGDMQGIENSEDMLKMWEADKAKERARNADGQTSLLDGVGHAMPALTRAQKLVKRATTAGFDWPDAVSVLPKLQEEIAELEVEIHAKNNGAALDELGDVLFTAVCLANKLKIDPETALRAANRKFEERFRAMEAEIQPKADENVPLERWEAAWNNVKSRESAKKG